jgi:hypothetical protein
MKFDRHGFEASAVSERGALCVRLAAELSNKLRGPAPFHGAVLALVAQLREGGHDLWSYDENDDFEVWGPNYVHPGEPGIVITFRADRPTEVTWSTQGASERTRV